MKGKFITLEGPDGSGKTTIALKICEYLESKNYKVLLTREPGGNHIAEQIREVILDKNNTAMDARTEALLYAASRRQHLVEKVKPALDDGYIVICDRFIDSSLVYQGVGRKIGINEVFEMNQFAIDGFMPEKTILFDVDYKIGLKRIMDGNREQNRLDLEGNEFHKQVYEAYLHIADKYQERITKIDASKSIDEVFKQAIDVIEEII